MNTRIPAVRALCPCRRAACSCRAWPPVAWLPASPLSACRSARSPPPLPPTPGRRPAVLSDTRIELAIGESLANFTGRTRPAITVNGSLPAPILRWREGQTVDLFVRNALERHPTSIHWHGILLPEHGAVHSARR